MLCDQHLKVHTSRDSCVTDHSNIWIRLWTTLCLQRTFLIHLLISSIESWLHSL